MLSMPSVTVAGIACPLLETHYAFVGATEPDSVFPHLVVAGKYRNSEKKHDNRTPVVLTMGDRAFDKRSFAPILRLLSPLPEAGKPASKSTEFHYLGTEAYPALEACMMIDRMSCDSGYNAVNADGRVASLRQIDEDELGFYFASALYAFDLSRVHPDYRPREDQLAALEIASRLLARIDSWQKLDDAQQMPTVSATVVNQTYHELAAVLQQPNLNAPLAAAALYLNLAMSMMGFHHLAEAEGALAEAESIYSRQESVYGLDLAALVRARLEQWTHPESPQDIFLGTTDVEASYVVGS